MPQYYLAQNIQCWVRAMIEEQFESYNTKKEQLAYIDKVSTLNGLKDVAEEAIYLQLRVDWITTRYDNQFLEAVLNTIDWQQLHVDVSNDMEEEKKALDDDSDSDEE